MVNGIMRPNTQTAILPVLPEMPLNPPGPTPRETSLSPGEERGNSGGESAEDCIKQLEAQLRDFQIKITSKQNWEKETEKVFQQEREALNESISILEAKLASGSLGDTTAPQKHSS
ncbi:hypothetical protein BS47DRAFT_1358803 [Hydnum rufescens UP504]|uniref:Uncharacterized protein n=1 Tax=Hydnum rufescens UP504 TaxID=1448309 RepID=A0A9P6DYI8_9AGAM|nr:hypothetical protein BS47DRAFT_1358803 [Hydnum rufescens UP504]